MRKDWSVFLFSDLQVHIVVCCSVPDGDEHSFVCVHGCHQACVGANATMFRFLCWGNICRHFTVLETRILLCGTDTCVRSPNAHDSFRVLFRRTFKSCLR